MWTKSIMEKQFHIYKTIIIQYFEANMKVVGFKALKSVRKKSRAKIYCVGHVFKPLVIGMAVAIIMLVMNLITGTFFANIHASMQNFVDSFVSVL